MKIAIVSDYYYPQLGGITEHVHGQATALTRLGHDVTVITPIVSFAPDCIDSVSAPTEIFKVRHIGRAYPFYGNASKTLNTLNPTLKYKLNAFYAKEEFDVVHVHSPHNPMLPLYAISQSIAPVTVATFHSVVPENYPLLKIFAPWLRGYLKNLDSYIAVSQAVIPSMGPYFPEANWRVISNGIDTDFFTPSKYDGDLVDQNKQTILFLGRFDPRNGLGDMIHAFIEIRQTRDNVRLVILGDGPLHSYYKKMVPDDLSDDVIFVGRVNQLRPAYLASADLLCTPCKLASFGMVLLEAMSCGLPVVANDISGFGLVLEDKKEGFLVRPPGDVHNIAELCLKVLDNPNLRAEMGAHGRQKALKTYAWPIIALQLEELYADLLVNALSRKASKKSKLPTRLRKNATRDQE